MPSSSIPDAEPPGADAAAAAIAGIGASDSHGGRVPLDRLAETIPFPLSYIAPDGVVRFVNLAYAALVGPAPPALIGQPLRNTPGLGRCEAHIEHVRRALAGENLQLMWLVESLAQGPRWLRTSFVPDVARDGRVVGVYTISVDVHDLTLAQEHLRRHIERDPLTDCFSRHSMMERIDAAVAAAVHTPVALFFIDLDRFKAINDGFGHQAGDDVLRAVASALQHAIRTEDTLGRFGGDEFLVLAPVHDLTGALALGQHMLAAVRNSCPGPLALTASIGIALAPDDASQSMALLRQADEAMYSAKRRGKDGLLHCSGMRKGA